MAARKTQGAATPGTAELAPLLLEVLEALLAELNPQQVRQQAVALTDKLESLGLDSLGRAELAARLGSNFGYTLSEEALYAAETAQDLLQALARGLRTHHEAPARQPQAPEDGRAARGGAGAAAPGASPGEARAAAGRRQAGRWEVPRQAATLVEMLAWWVEREPERRHVRFLDSQGQLESEWSYAQLWQGALRTAHGLHERGVQPGLPVALMLPTGPEYLQCFLGLLLAGCIPAPIYPPTRPSQLEEHMRRHASILQNAQAQALIAPTEARPLMRLFKMLTPALRLALRPQDLLAAAPSAPTAPPVPWPRAEDLGHLQYTSGSTGNPKGVALSHSNLLANIRAIGQGIEATPEDVVLSWLPLYHDMGLIGIWLGSLYFGLPLTLMSPLTFLTSPKRWLEALHAERATISGGPNFAYALCTRRIGQAELEGLDLRAWRCAFNGAEPVQAETLRRFARHFAPCGFRQEALLPVYGLAECAVGLSVPPPGRGFRVERLAQEALFRRGVAQPAAADAPQALEVVGCGLPLPGHEVRIVNARGEELGEREEGQLEFRGPSATLGYYRNPQATQALQRGAGWLDSGDRAYIAAGEIFITGREKEVIIRAGRNILPYALEEAIGQLPGVRKGCVAVFGAPAAARFAAPATTPASGPAAAPASSASEGERLIALVETRLQDAAARRALRQQIEQTAMRVVEAIPDDVVLVAPGVVLKTSSGKLRRNSCRALYLRGSLKPGRLAGQLLRVYLAAALPLAQRLLRRLGQQAFVLRFWSAFACSAALALPVVALGPTWRLRWGGLRRLARLAFRLSGLPLQRRGTEHLPAEPHLLACNHASYLDFAVLLAALPRPYRFTVKGELAQSRLLRWLLGRMRVVFVERLDTRKGSSETRRITQVLQAGESVIVFPEGTFTRRPGLNAFHLGGFSAAAASGREVLPAVLRGTRSVLRGDHFLPRQGRLRVAFFASQLPRGQGWAEALALQQAVRQVVLAHAGEPDLAATEASALSALRAHVAQQ